MSEFAENPDSLFGAENALEKINQAASAIGGELEARLESRKGEYKHPGFEYDNPGEADELAVKVYRVRPNRKDECLAIIGEEEDLVKGWVLDLNESE